jgi:hypothetical protein
LTYIVAKVTALTTSGIQKYGFAILLMVFTLDWVAAKLTRTLRTATGKAGLARTHALLEELALAKTR